MNSIRIHASHSAMRGCSRNLLRTFLLHTSISVRSSIDRDHNDLSDCATQSWVRWPPLRVHQVSDSIRADLWHLLLCRTPLRCLGAFIHGRSRRVFIGPIIHWHTVPSTGSSGRREEEGGEGGREEEGGNGRKKGRGEHSLSLGCSCGT